MLRKPIKYKDFNGDEQEDVCYFNLNKSELIEMDVETSGGMTALFQSLTETKDGASLVKILRTIILKSYGERSVDGKYFRKSEEIAQKFYNSNAYDELFMELLDEKKLEDFLYAILPTDGKSKEEIKAQAARLLQETNPQQANTVA